MQNKRKNIVVNKTFQYQHALMTVAVAILLINLFLIIQFLAPGASTQTLPSSTINTIAIIEFVVIAIVWYVSLRSSHKVAGPVYVISRELDKIGRGDLTARISLRKKDQFQDIAPGMNDSFSALEKRITHIKHLAAQVEAQDWSAPESSSAFAELRKELDSLTTSKAP